MGMEPSLWSACRGTSSDCHGPHLPYLLGFLLFLSLWAHTFQQDAQSEAGHLLAPLTTALALPLSLSLQQKDTCMRVLLHPSGLPCCPKCNPGSLMVSRDEPQGSVLEAGARLSSAGTWLGCVP